MRCVLEANSFQTWKQWCLRRQKQIRRSHCCGAMDPSEERRSTVFVDQDYWWAVSSAIEFWDKADRLFPQAAPLAQSLQHFHLPIHSANSQTTFVSSNLTSFDYLVTTLSRCWYLVESARPTVIQALHGKDRGSFRQFCLDKQGFWRTSSIARSWHGCFKKCKYRQYWYDLNEHERALETNSPKKHWDNTWKYSKL